MAKLIYTAITSLDGYIEDEEGRFDWAVPDPRGARLRQRCGPYAPPHADRLTRR
jgi:hypothetical protein